MRRCADDGMSVILIMCTDGGAGITDPSLIPDGQTLANIRRTELQTSADLLGVTRVHWLGFDDSGMDGFASENGFAAVPVETAASALQAAISEYQPDLVTLYDRNGGYGHPDHLRVWEAGHLAMRRAALDCECWEATIDRDFLAEGIRMLEQFGTNLDGDFGSWLGESERFLSAGEIEIRIDVRSVAAARRGSLAAHRSQGASPDSSSRMLALASALPDDLFTLAFGTEWFRRVSPAGPLEAQLQR